MTLMKTILASGAGLAALAVAAPAAAQYGYQYGYQAPSPYAYQYGYSNPYGSRYGYRSQYGYGTQYGYGNPYAYQASQLAVQRCQQAVQYKLQNRTSMASILGVLLGANMPSGRVLGVTQVTPRSSTVRVRGYASSGRYAGYSPYGVSAYGALGYGSQADISFTCDVDYRGYVRDIDFDRIR